MGRSWAITVAFALALFGCKRTALETGRETSLTRAEGDVEARRVDPAPWLALTSPVLSSPLPAPPSLSGKTALHVGDSMVGIHGGLTRALEARFAEEGARFVSDCKVSESIVSFDKSRRLRDLLAKHDPDIVIITLGMNDAAVPFPQSMAKNVRRIAERVGTRECYWIGPPTSKADTWTQNLVDVLRDNAAPCKFFDSSKLTLQRGGDGIHPTDKGGATWAEGFWAFFRKDG